MRKIFFTSDTHYGHANICRGVSKWPDTHSTRDFGTLEEMNQTIVDSINKYVGEDDTLYHLGDWSFGGINNIWEFRRQLNCKNIHLILGNHDEHIAKNKKTPNVFWQFRTGKLVDIENSTSDWDEVANCQDLFATVNQVRNIKVNEPKCKLFLSHYAHRVWDKSHHGVIHLYGHSHNSIDNNYGKSMDVGMDAIYALTGEYRPISLEEVLDIMKDRSVNLVDHHSPDTN